MYIRRRWQAIYRRVKRCKYEAYIVMALLVLMLLWLLLADNSQWRTSMSSVPYRDSSTCAPIDVVYTWVNGTDPAFVAALRRHNGNYDPARYDDKNELLYSLRSLERYAPWVRHVFIVTNGQIPHWLDLSYNKVTVIPHSTIAPKPVAQLPTFSSAAIETFLHRIPRLSPRFLYMNDDIFLGAPLYPEDLYTQSEGVRIYQAAWLVPDCADDCPWTYIGDGVCDQHCNIAACQHDGGDCEGDVMGGPTTQLPPATKKVDTAHAGAAGEAEVRHFPTPQQLRRANGVGVGFKELITRRRNSTTLHELRQIVEAYNRRLQQKQTKINETNHLHANHRRPEIVLTATTTTTTISPKIKTSSAYNKAALLTSAGEAMPTPQDAPAGGYRSTKDIYSHSLIYTNMLLNQHYGFKARNVLAHVGFLLEHNIMEAMQLKFATEVAATAQNKFRSPHDLQLAFAYYHFVMAETRIASVAEIFDEIDADGSGTWSDSEVRTFLARMFPLPLDWSALRFFEEVIHNCTQHLHFDQHSAQFHAATSAYERYEDSNLPTISRELVTRCEPLAEALHANFASRPRYKYNVVPKRAQANNFMMLTSNVTEVVEALDKLRRTPRKFNCINDNMSPEPNEDNALIRQLLEDFYRSALPHRSKFELQAEYRNRFEYVHEYQRWLRRKRAALFMGYSASLVLALFLLRLLCAHKAKFARRYVQKL